MKEILAWSDIDTIKDDNIKKYMFQTKRKATQKQEPWDFKNWGYWAIIDDWSELEQPLVGTYFMLPNLSQGLLNQLEIFEEKFGVCELLFLLNNEFGISLVMKESIIPFAYKQKFKSYEYKEAS
jgi:hypothetical protein